MTPPATKPSPTISKPSSCRSRRIGSSRRTRGCWPRPRACTTDAGRPQDHRRHRRPVVRQCRPRPRGDQGGDRQAARRDGLRTVFQMGHPKAFELAARHAALLPATSTTLFYCNSGSEAVDSAAQDRAGLPPARAAKARARVSSAASAAITASASAASPWAHGQQSQMVWRHAAGRRSPAAHPSGEERLLEGPARARRGAR